MVRRAMQQYVHLSRSVAVNNEAARKSARKPDVPPFRIATTDRNQKKIIPLKTPILNKIQDFFEASWFKWLRDLVYHKHYQYPSAINSPAVHLVSATGGNTVVIGLAADWANDTEQAGYIGQCIAAKGPDYTIHLGDTYYSGTAPEINASFGVQGLWPRGALGTFLLCGNHEMYSSGQAYYDFIRATTNRIGVGGNGHEPAFCLETDSWCILGLDTGYDCLERKLLLFTAKNVNLQLPPQVIAWLDKIDIRNKKKGIIILTHHQHVTAFHKEDEFIQPSRQLQTLLGNRKVLWIWGHEHRFAIYGKNKLGPEHLQVYGRCIGNGGMPDEHSPGRYLDDKQAGKRRLVLYDRRTADNFPLHADDVYGKDDFLGVGYNGYAILTLDNEKAKIDYYGSYKGDDRYEHKIYDAISSGEVDNRIFSETWQADAAGSISLLTTDPQTASPAPLTYLTGMSPAEVGR